MNSADVVSDCNSLDSDRNNVAPDLVSRDIIAEGKETPNSGMWSIPHSIMSLPYLSISLKAPKGMPAPGFGRIPQ
jgi:hypothetical protein